MEYGPEYHTGTSLSASFQNHLRYIVDTLSLQAGKTLHEIGCGAEAGLLRLLPESVRAYGIDPSVLNPSERLVRSVYSVWDSPEKADVILARHVAEHLNKPYEELLEPAARNLSEHGRIVLEVPDLDWTLLHGAWWDFYYEHCSYFSSRALHQLFNGLRVASSSLVVCFDGQFLLLQVDMGGTETYNAGVYSAPVPKTTDGMIQTAREELSALPGPLGIWGGGAKGVTFANLVDPDCEIIDAVIEITPSKVGRFVPGTGHRCISIADAGREGLCYAVLMNPYYQEEAFRRAPPGLKFLSPHTLKVINDSRDASYSGGSLESVRF